MAQTNFLQNLRTARNLFTHGVRPDRPTPDPRKADARTAVWLTPSSVRGFHVRDFTALAPAARDELKENVERFGRVAKQVPPKKQATPEQVKEATEAFVKVLDILAPYLPSGPENEQVEEALKKVRFPKCVLTWEYELGDDSTGDPAVWVWVIVEDEAAADDFLKVTTEMDRTIRNALSDAGVTRWPYVSYRTASEQREL